jgi:hypothetical protein
MPNQYAAPAANEYGGGMSLSILLGVPTFKNVDFDTSTYASRKRGLSLI